MSLASQKEEIDRLISNDNSVTIVDCYTEAYSAKQPGRPLFDEMMERIDQGEAEGIISWHPDRLARNSMDGGRIIFALDQGRLKNLLFCSFSFENSSQGKFMLNIIFGYSKYYSDALSENVKRGIRSKIKQGWRPNFAPTGYRNCKETRTVVVDPVHFKAVRRMFDLLLSANHTVAEIHRIACNGWAYTLPVIKSRGGKTPALSTVYRMLSNPFYAGYIKWNGQLHPGRHTPVVTKREFEQAQRLIRRTNQPRPKRLSFAYAGLFKCGVCGLSVTAERKRKPSGRNYIYYHCTRVHRQPKCNQPSVEERVLDTQIVDFLDAITVPQRLVDWLTQLLDQHRDELVDDKNSIAKKHRQEIEKLHKQLSNLTDLRIREMVTEDEFETKRHDLQLKLDCTTENANQIDKTQNVFEPLQTIGLLSVRAKNWYLGASETNKRKLLQIVCSNPSLRDRKALLVPKKPLLAWREMSDFPDVLGDVNKVRNDNNSCRDQQLTDVRLHDTAIENLQNLARDEDTKEFARQLTNLPDLISPAPNRRI